MSRRLACLVLMLSLVGGAVLPGWSAPPPLKAKRDITLGDEAAGDPTDVVVDNKGRVYLLYSQSGLLDIFDNEGKRLQRRGGPAEDAGLPERIVPINQWVGRFAKSLVLVSEPGQRSARWVLDPGDKRFEALELQGAPEELTGNSVVARGPEGRIFVVNEDTSSLYIFGGSSGTFQTRVRVPDFDRPMQLAVDAGRKLYVLDARGLHVLGKKGEPLYRVDGARTFYLTGAGVLAAAGDGWIRRFSPDGAMEVEALDLPEMKGRVPVAISLDDEEAMFLYLREPVSGDGLILKLDKTIYPTHEFFQPVRFPPGPDPGYRLDYQGRLHYWDADTLTLLKLHPGGKVERALRYTRDPDARGYMVAPSGMVVDRANTVWIADSGNLRLQRFNLEKGGWQEPVPVGIRKGAPRAAPTQLALAPDGSLYGIVYPLNEAEEVVLHRRDLKGRLLSQRPLGEAAGKPVFKVAIGPQGNIFVYRTGGSPSSQDYVDYAELALYNPRGTLLKKVGGEAQDFHLPNEFLARTNLTPFDDMLPWSGGLLIPTGEKFLYVDSELKLTKARQLFQRRGRPGGDRLPQFAGSAIYKGVLYVTDTANRCIHVIPLGP